MTLCIRKALFGLAGLLLLGGLSGCAMDQLINPPAKQGEMALEEFVRALRLEEYQAAASHLAPEYRQDFLDTFTPLKKDLTIIDVRIDEITLIEEGKQADVTMEMEYFLLPSASVKTFLFNQTWIYYEAKEKEPAFYQVETPFPPFP